MILSGPYKTTGCPLEMSLHFILKIHYNKILCKLYEFDPFKKTCQLC